MTAPGYSETRSKLALGRGLGRVNRKGAKAEPAPAAQSPAAKPKGAGRSRKAEA